MGCHKSESSIQYWKDEISTIVLYRDLTNMKKVITRDPSNEDLKFLDAINADELISSDEEAELIKQIQRAEGDVEAAKEKLFLASHRFVRSVALKYVSPNFTLDDLMSHGNIGLENAIYRFDETQGYKFITYAKWWIRQRIQQYVLEKEKGIFKLKDLSASELDIIRMYFGLGTEKKSMDDIQAKYNLSPKTCSAITDHAIYKLFRLNESIDTVREVLLGTTEDNQSIKK